MMECCRSSLSSLWIKGNSPIQMILNNLASTSKLNIHDPMFDLLVKGITNHFLLQLNNSFKDQVYSSGVILQAWLLSLCVYLCLCQGPLNVPGILPRPCAIAYCQTVSKKLKYNHLFISLFNLFSEMEKELVRAVSRESKRHCAARVLWLCR